MSLTTGEKRLLKDVIHINKHPLHDQGIFYIHDSNNIKKGYALIIGPENTIYSHGMYFFKFTYPDDYPYSPPHVEYLTNNDKVRFNPNLYRNGKVCISILNTWSGPQWSSCQNISSVLLTLVTLFHNKPLLNEPGLTESHESFHTYNKIIRYSSFKIGILDILQENICKNMYHKFKTHIHNHIKANKDSIIEKAKEIDKMLLKNEKKTWKMSVYSIRLCCEKKGVLLEKFNECFEKL